MKEEITELIIEIIIKILKNNLFIESINIKDLILKRFNKYQYQNTLIKFKEIILIIKNIRTQFHHIYNMIRFNKNIKNIIKR